MVFRIEHDCPQCAAPLEMNDTDRLLHCRFCNVRSFLANPDPLHFVLPRKEPDPYTIYVPYHHFKGTIYSCLGTGIEHRLTDISTRGVKLDFLPPSLGLRPQAMKMRFVTPELPGSFIKSTENPDIIFKRVAKNLPLRDEKILHQTFVGDVLDTIHLPLSIRDEQIFDGIIDSPLTRIPENGSPFAGAEIAGRTWKPLFLSALCPQCGWSLDGEPDSVVLLCGNCNTAWQASDGNFSAVRLKITPAAEGNSLYIPFWNFRVKVSGIGLDSFADFMTITNQPFVVRPEWRNWPLHFTIPAFKIRPEDFLRLASQLTIGQRRQLPVAENIPGGNLYPATLLSGNAAKIMKILLANSTVSNSNVYPYLPEIEIDVVEYSLHYLPFEKTTHELRQIQLGVTINQRVLNYGRSL